MGFGTKYTYNPVPQKLHIELISREKYGKTSFLVEWAKPGMGIIVDSDGRFGDAVSTTARADFYPLCDKQSDMLDVDKIVEALEKNIPSVEKEVSIIAVDTLTKILEPIITKIQAKGKTNLYSYKEKADAMKKLRHAVTKWGTETAWVYHKRQVYKENPNAKGFDDKYILVDEDFLNEVEQTRLGADITLSLEIVVDERTGKRGVKVLYARRGRMGITVWDDIGNWKGFRNTLEQAVWGGLTEEDQSSMGVLDENPLLWESPKQAMTWAWRVSQEVEPVFNDAKHVENSYDALKEVLVEQYGADLTADIFYTAWKQKVISKLS